MPEVQFQEAYETILRLVADGQIDDAVKLIIERQDFEERILSLRGLNSAVIVLINRAYSLALDFVRDLDLDQERVHDLNHARDLARAHASAFSKALARGFDLARDLGRARDIIRDKEHALDRARAIDRTRALDRAYSLALDLALELAHDLDLARDRAQDLDRALDLFLDHDLDVFLEHARGFARTLDRDLARAYASALDYARTIAQELDHALVRALGPDLALDHEYAMGAARASALAAASTNLAPEELAAIGAVNFTAFYPPQVIAQMQARLLVYTHVGVALGQVEQDATGASTNPDLPMRKTPRERIKLKPGTMVTLVPECAHLTFNPPVLTKRWEPDWVRYDFGFKASDKLIGVTTSVEISVQVEGVEIARIRHCAIDVAANADSEASVLVQQSAKPYQKIFISYSHKDAEVILAYKAAQDAIGKAAFVDTESIRATEDWMGRLAIEIDAADTMQLFWSENAAVSEFVRDEWEYAMLAKCPADQCIDFIRPVFWDSDRPNPEPPEMLAHLLFRRIDLVEAGAI